MNYQSGWIEDVLSQLIATGARQAVKYVTADYIVKATLIAYDAKPPRKNSSSASVVVTFGKPNYAERKFVAHCEKAKEPFPVKKVQLKFFNN